MAKSKSPFKKGAWVKVKMGAVGEPAYARSNYDHELPEGKVHIEIARKIGSIGEWRGKTGIWLHINKEYYCFQEADLEPIAAIDGKIIAFKADFEFARLQWERDKEKKAAGAKIWVNTKPTINWDEEWDGLLLQRIQALRDEGFEVTDFWRKQKIKMRKPKDLTHGEIVTKVIAAVGDEFTGITFKPGVSVWWGATTRKWW